MSLLARRFERHGPVAIVVFTAAAVAWGLVHYGGTETAGLYRLSLLATVPVALALLLWAPRTARVGEWVLSGVGLALLLRAALSPTLLAAGYLRWALGWMAFYVAYRAVGGSAPLVVPEARTVSDAEGPRRRAVPRAARLLVASLVALGALEALYGLAQVIGVGGLQAGSGGHLEGMATGGFVNRNHYAGFLNLVLPLAVGALYAAYARRWGRRSRTEMLALAWTALLASAFIGVAVLLSRSRGGTVTLVVTVAFIGTLLALGRRTSRRGLSSVASATLAGLIVLLGLAVGLDALLARFAEIEQTRTRLAVYEDTFDLIAAEPLGGTGPGMYRWRFRPYQTADLGSLYHHAHNDYLETAAEWGVPLALAFWGFVLLALRGAVLVALSSKDPWRRGLALAAAGSIVSILLHSLFDFNLQIPVNLMVFASVLGLAHGVSRSVVPTAASEAKGPRRRGWLEASLAVVLLLALGFASVRTWSRLEAAEMARGAVDLASLEEASRRDPTNPEIRFLLAIAYRDHPEQRDLAAARENLERATELNPHAWRYWLELSRLEELAGRPAEAEQALGRAVELNPRRGDYRWRLANFHLRHGATDEAFAELGAAVELDPTLGRAAFHLLTKAGADWSTIERLWPDAPAERLALLDLACRRPLPAAAVEPPTELLEALWESALAGPEPPPIERASFYVSHLLGRGALDEARDAWIDLAASNGVEDAAFERGDNYVWDGGFELSLDATRARGPLEWRVSRGEGFRVRWEEGAGKRGAALRVDFTGENVDFRHVSQRLVAPAAETLLLTASLRSEGLSTDNGVYLEVVADGRVVGATDAIADAPSWTAVEASFDLLPSATEPAADSLVVLEIRLRRLRSHRIAGKIEGTIWLDDVRLVPSSVVSSGPALAAVERRTLSSRPGGRWAVAGLVAREVLAQAGATAVGRLEIVSQPGVVVGWDGIEVGRTDEDGRLLIEGIPPGPYVLGLSKAGYREAMRRVTVDPGDNRMELWLEPSEPETRAPERSSQSSRPKRAEGGRSGGTPAPPVPPAPQSAPTPRSLDSAASAPNDTGDDAVSPRPSAASGGTPGPRPAPTRSGGKLVVALAVVALLAAAYLLLRHRMARFAASGGRSSDASGARTPSFLADLRRRERALERRARQSRVIDAEARELPEGVESDPDTVSRSDRGARGEGRDGSADGSGAP